MKPDDSASSGFLLRSKVKQNTKPDSFTARQQFLQFNRAPKVPALSPLPAIDQSARRDRREASRICDTPESSNVRLGSARFPPQIAWTVSILSQHHLGDLFWGAVKLGNHCGTITAA